MKIDWSHMSDEELAERMAQGKKEAFDILYQRYAKLMLNYFYRMLWQDKEKAQDFTQDLFLKLIQNPKSFDASRSFKTWFYSVANNMCKNEYKKQSVRANTQVGIEPYQQTASKEVLVDEQVQMSLFKDQFASELAEMDENHRQVVILRHLEGLSVKDIAEQLSINEGTVKSRIFYATKSLAQKLAAFNTK